MIFSHRPFRLLVLLALPLFLAACSDDSPTESETPESGLVQISLLADSFSRTNVLVEAGTTVRWTAQTPGHTITPDGHSEWERVEITEVGQTFEHTFDTPGTYDYFCEPHLALGMTGVIRVE